jgi:tripartite-type tricarboxylate transporter receptor subunit TctC
MCPPWLNSAIPGTKHRHGREFVAPAKTPPAIVEKLNRQIRAVFNDTAVREKLQAAGVEPIESTPEDFAAYIQSETQKWHEVIKAANISLN